MNFETYKAEFDKSFAKVNPDEFIAQMESLGYEFESSNYSNSIDSIRFSMPTNLSDQKPRSRNVFLSFCSKLLISKKTNVNWKLPTTLINAFEKGVTVEDLNCEQMSIDFDHFKFQQLVSEEKNFKIEETQNKFSVSISEDLIMGYNPDNEPNKEAA